ncbi:MAG: S41 family peptidase [Bacteroidales bacterium]
MRNNNTLFCFLFAFSAIISGCSNEEDNLLDQEVTLNRWIHNQMKGNYLWLEEIKEAKYYNTSADPQEFFKSLISSNEMKTRNGTTYWYSYMEKKVQSTRVSNAPRNTYGIEFVLYSFANVDYYYARVLYVIPGSPAEKCGVRRGMWIKKINSEEITSANWKLLQSGNGAKLEVYEGVLTNNIQNTRVINLGSQESLYETPFLKDTVLVGTDGTKVGYLAYTHFSTGPTGPTDITYDNQMRDVFGKFKSRGVREFILDMRYNPGGYLSCATLLSSLLIPQSKVGEVFSRVTYNPASKMSDMSEFFSSQDNNLNLSRVYVLAGSHTASASEAVINGLMPMMDVVILGEKTEGKNLGSVTFQDSRFDWILHPIVATISNAKGEGDYWKGINPTKGCEYNEFQSVAPLGALGTPDDALIQMALVKMGVYSSRTVSAITSDGILSVSPVCSSLQDKSFEAVRLD